MRFCVSREDSRLVKQEIAYICASTRFLTQAEYIQHGDTSVLRHCICVAYMSCFIACKLNLHLEKRALIRGALLHDYFLYDWHVADSSHRLHGFRHPKTALRNAMRDIELSPKEQNIILRHMFPLTPIPPVYYEAWVVCMADKICSALETMHFSIEYGCSQA